MDCLYLKTWRICWFPLQGIPLHLQIDTYEDLTNPDAEPVHRSFCQIKVFRDKVSEPWFISIFEGLHEKKNKVTKK